MTTQTYIQTYTSRLEKTLQFFKEQQSYLNDLIQQLQAKESIRLLKQIVRTTPSASVVPRGNIQTRTLAESRQRIEKLLRRDYHRINKYTAGVQTLIELVKAQEIDPSKLSLKRHTICKYTNPSSTNIHGTVNVSFYDALEFAMSIQDWRDYPLSTSKQTLLYRLEKGFPTIPRSFISFSAGLWKFREECIKRATEVAYNQYDYDQQIAKADLPEYSLKTAMTILKQYCHKVLQIKPLFDVFDQNHNTLFEFFSENYTIDKPTRNEFNKILNAVDDVTELTNTYASNIYPLIEDASKLYAKLISTIKFVNGSISYLRYNDADFLAAIKYTLTKFEKQFFKISSKNNDIKITINSQHNNGERLALEVKVENHKLTQCHNWPSLMRILCKTQIKVLCDHRINFIQKLIKAKEFYPVNHKNGFIRTYDNPTTPAKFCFILNDEAYTISNINQDYPSIKPLKMATYKAHRRTIGIYQLLRPMKHNRITQELEKRFGNINENAVFYNSAVAHYDEESQRNILHSIFLVGMFRLMEDLNQEISRDSFYIPRVANIPAFSEPTEVNYPNDFTFEFKLVPKLISVTFTITNNINSRKQRLALRNLPLSRKRLVKMFIAEYICNQTSRFRTRKTKPPSDYSFEGLPDE